MKLTMLKRIQNRNSGFTLIELLVVIILISLLAIALIAYINPVEQRRKAQDTAKAAIAAEWISAQERYYTSVGCYTWNYNTTNSECDPPGTGTADITGSDNDLLVSQGEAKNSLINRLNTEPYSTDLVATEDSDESLHVSFEPDSEAFLERADYSDATCVTSATPPSTYYCVPDSE